MSSVVLEVVLEGSAVDQGAIDVRLLAESLLGYSEVFSRANSIVNGERSDAKVLVSSGFKPGSFIADLQFVQSVKEAFAGLITAYTFLNADDLAGLIGFLWKGGSTESLIALFKWLRGGEPDSAQPISSTAIELTFGQNKRTVNNYVYNLYGDSAIREGLGRITQPLRQAEIDRISMRVGNAEQTSFDKSDAEYFGPKEGGLNPPSTPTEGERDADLIVSKLSFTEKTNGHFWSKAPL